MTSPRRGEVWLVDLGMAAKVRPALVISVPAEDATEVMSGVTEVLCYGTAVVVVPVES